MDNRIEPVLRRPLLERVFGRSSISGCNGQVDRLVVMLPVLGEGVDDGDEGE